MPNQPEPIILNVQGNAKSEAAAIAGELAKTEEQVEASKAVLKDLQGSLRETKARAKELAAAYAELKDEQLRSAAKGAYEEAREEVDGLTQSIAHVKAQQKAAKDEAATCEFTAVMKLRMPFIERVAVVVPSEFVAFSTPRMTSFSRSDGTWRKVFASASS